MCMFERERQRKRETDRQTDRVSERQRGIERYNKDEKTDQAQSLRLQETPLACSDVKTLSQHRVRPN